MRTQITIDFDDASRLLALSLKSATERSATVSVALVDAAGILLAFARMEGAKGHTVDLAQKKARAAALSGVATRAIDEAIKAGLVTSVESVGWGGLPVGADGQCAGGIGISGAAPEMDEAIAALALEAYANGRAAGAHH